jgi:ubiquinone/menaquinone biosynthesis C-methylase UbiE
MSNLNKDIELFWDDCHDKNIMDSLSGCQYDETIDFLKIRSRIKSGINVLEIGVGLGYVTKGLFENNMKVTALDISDVSLERVSNYCEDVYNVKDVHSLPSDYFDIIICNNVIQHVPTDILVEELKEIMRSLKIDGMFAIEFVSNDVIEDTGVNPSLDVVKNGGCCRAPKYLEKLIRKIGGKCELVFTNDVDFGVVKGHHVFHVTKLRNMRTL